MANNKQNANQIIKDVEIAAGAALIGAAVGATAVALTNPDVRKGIDKKVEEIKDEVEKKRDEAGDTVNKAKADLAKKLK